MIAKAGPASLGVGQQITYSLTVRNGGPASAFNATVSDTVPNAVTGVTWTCASSGQAACGVGGGSGNTINLRVTVRPGGENSVVITVTGTAATVGTVVNTAQVDLPPGMTDPVPGNNTSTVTTVVGGPAPSPPPSPSPGPSPTPSASPSAPPSPSPSPVPSPSGPPIQSPSPLPSPPPTGNGGYLPGLPDTGDGGAAAHPDTPGWPLLLIPLGALVIVLGWRRRARRAR